MKRREFVKNVCAATILGCPNPISKKVQQKEDLVWNLYNTPCLNLYNKTFIPDGQIAEYPAELYFPNGASSIVSVSQKPPHKYLLESGDYINVPTFETIKESQQEVFDSLEFNALQTLMCAAQDRNIIIDGNYSFRGIINSPRHRTVLYSDHFISNVRGPYRYGITNIQIPDNVWKKVLFNIGMVGFDYPRKNLGILVNSKHRALVSPIRVELTKITEGWMSERGLACLNNDGVCLVSFD